MSKLATESILNNATSLCSPDEVSIQKDNHTGTQSKKMRVLTKRKIAQALIDIRGLQLLPSRELIRKRTKISHNTIQNRWDDILLFDKELDSFNKLSDYFPYYNDLCSQRNSQLTQIIHIYKPFKEEVSLRDKLSIVGFKTNTVTGRYNLDETHNGKTILSYFLIIALRSSNTLQFRNFQKYITYAGHLSDVYISAMSSDTHHVSSQHSGVKWMFNNDAKFSLITKYFSREGVPSKRRGEAFKYIPQPIIHNIMKSALNMFSSFEFDSSIHYLGNSDSIFRFPLSELKDIRIQDAILIISKALHYTDGYLICGISESKEKVFRATSWFQQLHKTTRTYSHQYSADISTLGVAIRLHLCSDVEKYPLHKQYADDKLEFRSCIASALGISKEDAKHHLMIADNKTTIHKPLMKSDIGYKYCLESIALIDDILDNLSRGNILSNGYKASFDKARKVYKMVFTDIDDYDWVEVQGERDKKSLISYITQYYERLIIEAIRRTRPTFTPQVFDCVYSKEPFDLVALEDAILIHTGIKVRVEAD